jgi:hypothetical protein
VVGDITGETALHSKEITELEAQEDSVEPAGDATSDEPRTDTEDTLPPNTLYEED